MVFQYIRPNICQVPREMLKTSAYGLGFQHLPRDLANVNAWKSMFDPYIKSFKIGNYSLTSVDSRKVTLMTILHRKYLELMQLYYKKNDCSFLSLYGNTKYREWPFRSAYSIISISRGNRHFIKVTLLTNRPIL